jgi:hypothetical protein
MVQFGKFHEHCVERSLLFRVEGFRLSMGRGYAMQGDTTKAKAAYQDFHTLWKDADPDIPIFIAAKAEYSKLQ